MIIHHSFKWIELRLSLPEFKKFKLSLFFLLAIKILFDGLSLILVEADWHFEYS
jgi:hypothetical protein